MASRIITAAELEKMTPAQRQAVFDASVSTDLDQAPPELLARTRQRIEQLIAFDFFADLDRQLRPERGPHGEPSTNDFQTFELLAIVERFATGFAAFPS